MFQFFFLLFSSFFLSPLPSLVSFFPFFSLLFSPFVTFIFLFFPFCFSFFPPFFPLPFFLFSFFQSLSVPFCHLLFPFCSRSVPFLFSLNPSLFFSPLPCSFPSLYFLLPPACFPLSLFFLPVLSLLRTSARLTGTGGERPEAFQPTCLFVTAPNTILESTQQRAPWLESLRIKETKATSSSTLMWSLVRRVQSKLQE